MIYIGSPPDDADPSKLFLQQWNAELEKINADPECDPETYPEDRMYRAVREALSLARDAKREMGGVVFRNIQEGAIKQSGKYPRYGLRVELSADGQPFTVLIPVYFHNNGGVFRYYFDAMQEATAPPVAGALLVHRHSEFQMGEKAEARFEAEREKGRLRVFALEDYPLAFTRLECLLRFLNQAAGQELLLGEVTLGVEDCRDCLIKTAALDNLDLFKQMSCWRRPVGVQKPVAVAAVGSGGKPPVSGTAVPKQSPVAPEAVAVQTTPPSGPEPSGSSGAPGAGASEGRPSGSPLKDHALKYTSWAKDRLQQLVRMLTVWGQPVKPIEPDSVRIGASFARLKVMPANAKTTFKKVCDKATDLRIHLGLKAPPVIESQPGFVSIDIQLPEQAQIPLADALADVPAKLRDGDPAFPVGLDVEGRSHWLNLADTSDCHLLVAGTTGSGKSEFLRSLVAGLATRLSYEQVQFFLVDPKRVTFNIGDAESPYIPRPIAYDSEQALELPSGAPKRRTGATNCWPRRN